MRILRPLRERDFALLWTGLTVSLIGDGIYFVAVAWQAYDLSNSPSSLALVGLGWSAGLALFLLTGGVISDRMDRRRVMIVADIVRAAALTMIGVLALTGTLQLWQLVALVVLYAAGEAFFGPALGALVPDVLPASLLVEANSLEQMMRQSCRLLIGPGIGGIIVATLGAGQAFLIDGGSFVVSALMIAAMRTRSKVVRETASTIGSDLRDGIAYVRSQRYIWVTLLASSIAMLLFYGPMQVLLPYVVRNRIGGGASAFGLVLAADGIGSVIASVYMSRRGLPRRYLTVMFSVWAAAMIPLIGYAVIGYAIDGALWQLMVLSGIHGLLMTIGVVIWGTLLQRRVPAEMRGRVRSLDWFVGLGFVPLSFALTGPLAATIGVEATLIVAGGGAGVSTLLLFFSLRMSREQPQLPPPHGDPPAAPAPATPAEAQPSGFAEPARR